jgi:hypothetical protein
VGLFKPKNNDDYREIAAKVGRGEAVNSIDLNDYYDYKKQCGSVPRELQRIEEDARKSGK